MKVVVDTNIIFSAILNPSAAIGQILIYSRRNIHFFAPNLVRTEIQRHKDKLLMLTNGMSEATFEDIRDEIFSSIQLISEEQIPFDYWHKAIPLVRETDMDDLAFVVLAEFLDARLWTGDKKLKKGLEQFGYTRSITLEELISFNIL